jgi:hypothetical protein
MFPLKCPNDVSPMTLPLTTFPLNVVTPMHLGLNKGPNKIRGDIARGNVVCRNVIRGNVVRGNIIRGNVIRGNVVRGIGTVPVLLLPAGTNFNTRHHCHHSPTLSLGHPHLSLYLPT